jgi:hypothetical protein
VSRLLHEGVGGKRYTIRRMERGMWVGVGKQRTEKESFQQYFYNRYKILHTCHTYCCHAYHFYAYWLYFIYVWHVYVSPKTYKWFGTFIIKDGGYAFTFFSTNISTEYFKHAAHSPFFSSKCGLFHNATFFGSCIIHIFTYRMCKNLNVKLRCQKVN